MHESGEGFLKLAKLHEQSNRKYVYDVHDAMHHDWMWNILNIKSPQDIHESGLIKKHVQGYRQQTHGKIQMRGGGVYCI